MEHYLLNDRDYCQFPWETIKLHVTYWNFILITRAHIMHSFLSVFIPGTMC